MHKVTQKDAVYDHLILFNDIVFGFSIVLKMQLVQSACDTLYNGCTQWTVMNPRWKIHRGTFLLVQCNRCITKGKLWSMISYSRASHSGRWFLPRCQQVQNLFSPGYFQPSSRWNFENIFTGNDVDINVRGKYRDSIHENKRSVFVDCFLSHVEPPHQRFLFHITEYFTCSSLKILRKENDSPRWGPR